MFSRHQNTNTICQLKYNTKVELEHFAGEGKNGHFLAFWDRHKMLNPQRISSTCGLNVLKNMSPEPSPDSESQQTQSSERTQFSAKVNRKTKYFEQLPHI